MISQNKFIEHAEFSGDEAIWDVGNCYGTSFEAVETVKKSGKICVLDLEVKGVQSIKKSPLNAKFV